MSFYGDNIQSSLTSTLFGPGATATSINAFKAKFSDGGARANMFSVTLPFPSWVSYGLDSSTQMQFLCKATALPSTSITTNPVVYRGRTINIAAERTFQPWTVTIYNSTDFVLRNAFEQWSKGILAYNAHTGKSTLKDYCMDGTVTQLDKNNETLKSYDFVGCWPSDIGQIALDYSDGSAVETFEVTMQYYYFEPSDI